MPTSTPSLLDRYQGALVGLAAGDALGTTLEFTPRNAVKPISDMVGGGPFNLAPGQWTDDTSMAMCLAESLIERGFDARDQMERYRRWWKEGYWSSTGRCFDIGNTISAALQRFIKTHDPIAGSTDPHSAGNGSLMRLAPVALRYAHAPADAVKFAAESSKTTHGAPEAVDACRYFAALIVGALDGQGKDELLARSFAPRAVDWNAEPLSAAIATIAAGSYKTKTADAIYASGYVVHTLEAALWAFFHSTNFRDGALLAVNLGDDADTTGAVYGQLAGAYYGIGGIPSEWRKRIARAKQIETLATVLFTQRNADAARQLEAPWPLSIVTCPAVQGHGLQHYEPARMKDVPEVMRTRTAKVLAVAAAHEQTRLILGAWGCGAFGLDPEMMAGIFRDALDTDYQGVFEEIVLAITDWSDERRFIGPFARRFATSV